jgi:hypothetical protein
MGRASLALGQVQLINHSSSYLVMGLELVFVLVAFLNLEAITDADFCQDILGMSGIRLELAPELLGATRK